jgi:hypothetical protein
MYVTFGLQAYGQVKKVASTSIVTRFWMLSSFPIFPLESFYFLKYGKTTFVQRELIGVPLARLDWLSVLVAYLRGVFGGMFIVGFFVSFIILATTLSEGREQPGTRTFLAYSGSAFVIGVVAGSLTYLPYYQISSRQREIRRSCEKVLGIAADPARVRLDHARSMEGSLSALQPPDSLSAQIQELALTRLRIALGEDRKGLEISTDDLLEKIRILESAAGTAAS